MICQRRLPILWLLLLATGCAHAGVPEHHAVAARLEIRELIDRYNDAINHRNWTNLRALFAADAVWEVAPPIDLKFQTADKIAAGIEWSVGRLEFLVQTSSAVVIELHTPQRASARSTLIELGRPKPGGPPGMRAAGTYYDELTREGGTWRFKHRMLRVRYMDEVANPGQVFENNPPRQ